MDFFDFPVSEKFDTIIGNPPYVRFQDIAFSPLPREKGAILTESELGGEVQFVNHRLC